MNEISDFIALQSSENTKEGYARVLGRFLIYCNGSLPTGNAWRVGPAVYEGLVV